MSEAKRIKEQEAEDAIARERDLFLEEEGGAVSAKKKVVDLMAALEESVREAKEARLRQQAARTGGEDAIARERELFIEDGIQVEGTEESRRRFAEKMREWRRDGGIPGYTGPRAGRDS